PPAPPTEAETTLDAALTKLKAHQTIAAEILEQVDMLSQKFRLKGRFLKAPGYRVYLSLTLEGLGDASGTTLQVCDGTALWDYSKILDIPPSCRKLTLAPILKKLESPDCDPDLRTMVLTQFGFSGPDTLLEGLRKSVAFNQKAETTLEGRKVWELRGEWKDRAALALPAGAFPPYVPSVVAVWVDQETGFPYRVEVSGRSQSLLELQKRDNRPLGPDGRPIGAKTAPQRERPSKIILTYSDVKLDQPIEDAQFAFQPGNIPVDDATERYVSELEKAITDRALQKKAEAAKAGANDLPAIPVPAPGGSPAVPPAPDSVRSTAPPPR
ncbi:MAG: hypothetical protein IRY99_01270, partial [Isosphaeraceae bacterium]|nr:hypothetical protein [Isosphaeraceae bacterium]